jgi:flavin-dependent dehydrogenase
MTESLTRGERRLTRRRSASRLEENSRVAVIGGGPAGSFFAYFLLDLAARAHLRIHVDVYEPRDFSLPAPQGCNMCGGIVSESLVQSLATEGINIPANVVQRGIDSYILHMDVGTVRIDTPLHEMRIAAVYRGAGPRDVGENPWTSFDGFLQERTAAKGARIIRKRVEGIDLGDGQARVRAADGESEAYELIAIASGINSFAPKLLQGLPFHYAAPKTTKTLIREYRLGREAIRKTMGSSMHVFLLNIPRLEFAALIPKGDYATLCLLGDDIDRELVESFLKAPEVRASFPEGWDPQGHSCQCWPRINVLGAPRPYGDRYVLLGDCGVTRLYKDGIGGAYRAAKAAAATAVLHGVSEEAFRRHYLPHCRRVATDNSIGRVTFLATRIIQRARFARRVIWRMTVREQRKEGRSRRLSQVLWDMFTGSASYKDVLLRTMHPAFLGGLAKNAFSGDPAPGVPSTGKERQMERGGLGRRYEDGESIIRQGDIGEDMYVIQEGRVRITMTRDGAEIPLRTMGEGEFFGEMALFDREVRSATARADGPARVLTVDRHSLLRRIQEDPSLAFRIIEMMSGRVRQLSSEIADLRSHAGAVPERRV